MVDTHDSKSCARWREGSTPSSATKMKGFSIVSYEFIEADFPCKTCITQAMCKYVDRLEVKVKRSKVLAVPEFEEDTHTYHKVLMECWVNLGNEIFRNTQTIVASNCKTVKKHGMPYSYLSLMRQMAALMEYMINSASWRDGIEHEFDSIEIDRHFKMMRS